jgi:hypothetical protein
MPAEIGNDMVSRADQKIRKELATLRQRFTSLEEMAGALRVHAGFEQLNRATLSRWMDHPAPRAALAIRLLKSQLAPARLRIAEPQSLSVLPSAMLCWKSELRKPYGLLQKRYGLATAEVKTWSGGEAFELLARGRAEIALGSTDLLTQLGPDCLRVCSLSKVYITGITRMRIESVSDLQGKTFGYLKGSAFGMRLEHLTRTWGVHLPPPRSLETVQHCVRELKTGRIQGMFGSEPSVSQVSRALGRSLPIFPLRQGLLGSYEMHVAVNLRTVYPAAVRSYLSGIQETIRYTNGRKAVATFHAEIASRYQMNPWDVRNVLTNIHFSLEEFEPAAVLRLWEREVVELRRGQ